MKNKIVAEMIKRLTDNEIVINAVNNALNDSKPGIKFTEIVRSHLPEIVGDDDGFCFDNTPETIAADELMRVQIIIDNATDGELNVVSVDQI